jgi:RHS repeat-associated protein
MRRSFNLSRFLAFLAGAVCLLVAAAEAVLAGIVSTTTVTAYEYNDDGAPTSITTQQDGGAPSTVYLTWDNFVPDADDPTSGTASSGNGNLAAEGSDPSSSSAVYTFDRRDRLTGYASGAQKVTYAYYADGMMASSTTADGEGFSFYYDQGKAPQMINVRQVSDGRWSARLGAVRHLSDGTDQVLMTPRKDVSCEYDSSADTISAYRYDAFGACTCTGTCTCTESGGQYDIRDNPFRYAGEYRDAIWQGQYLRARWYDPQVPSFVSRDPLAHLNRYGYGDANPVMMTDPRGMKAGFWKGLARGFDEVIDTLNSGVQGHFARLFLSPVLYPLEIVAHPVRFWNQTTRDPVQIAFIGLSAAAAVVGGIAGGSLATLELRQTGIGLTQSVFAGFDDLKSKHFDATAFIDSAEMAIGASLTPAISGVLRGLRDERSGINDGVDIHDVHRSRASNLETEYRIYRGRQAHVSGLNYTNPFLDQANIGLYSEILVAAGKDNLFAVGLVDGEVRMGHVAGADIRPAALNGVLADISRKGDPAFQFQYLGTLLEKDLNIGAFTNPPPLGKVGRFFNNSHTYAHTILRLATQRN